MSEHLKILEAIHDQVERLDVGREPMSPVERQLANALLVTLNVLIDERRARHDPETGEVTTEAA